MTVVRQCALPKKRSLMLKVKCSACYLQLFQTVLKSMLGGMGLTARHFESGILRKTWKITVSARQSFPEILELLAYIHFFCSTL